MTTTEASRSNDLKRVAAAAGHSQEYLTMCLGDEEYGVDILRVQEIRGYEQPTRIAGAPNFIGGVLNLRGVIVPIVDLRIKFGLENIRAMLERLGNPHRAFRSVHIAGTNGKGSVTAIVDAALRELLASA